MSRAVERVREYFAHRGVTVGAGGLVVVISANAVQAAPSGLAISLAAVVVKGATAATTKTALIIEGAKLLVWTTTKTAIAAGLGVLLIASTAFVYQTMQTNSGSRKDGSFWALDAYDHRFTNKTNYEPIELRRIDLPKDVVAFGAAGRGVMGVALTRDGEVWAWGKALGEYTSAHPNLQSLAKTISWKTDRFQSKPVIHDKPWRLPNSE